MAFDNGIHLRLSRPSEKLGTHSTNVLHEMKDKISGDETCNISAITVDPKMMEGAEALVSNEWNRRAWIVILSSGGTLELKTRKIETTH